MKKFSLFLVINLIILNSCGLLPYRSPTENQPASSSFQDDECLPVVTNLAYPVGISPSPATEDEEQPELQLLGNWQMEATLPASTSFYFPQLAIKERDAWILNVAEDKVFRYNLDTQTWKEYDKIGDRLIRPDNLRLAMDGTPWGFNVIRETGRFLSRYNETTDQFEFVHDVDHLLDNITISGTPAHITEDPSGTFWFTASDRGDADDIGVYSFSPATLKAKKHISRPKGYGFSNIAVSREGVIWVYSGHDRKLLTYYPESGELVYYYGPPTNDFENFGYVGPLFFDKDDRLWIGNKGWLDFSNADKPIWYQIIPSPVFVVDNGWFRLSYGDGLLSKYGVYPVTGMSQISNGWLWFQANGLIWLDPVEEKWCRFTNASGPIVEDNHKNLWMVAFDKLYKYQLEK